MTKLEKALQNYEKRKAAYEKEPTFKNDFWKDIAHDKYIDELNKRPE